MCGCCSAAVVLISTTNRSAPSTAASSGLQHLERDFAIVLQVVREVHGRHAAVPELALDAVAVGERDRQRCFEFRHARQSAVLRHHPKQDMTARHGTRSRYCNHHRDPGMAVKLAAREVRSDMTACSCALTRQDAET